MNTGFINHEKIFQNLGDITPPSKYEVREILTHAKELKGLSHQEAEKLLLVENQNLYEEILNTANEVKNEIYGKRLVLFAPLYTSNYCNNECLYCGFRKSNHTIPRKALTVEEIKRETEALIKEGHKRVLLVSGEMPKKSSLQYTLDAIETIYRININGHNIRRINVNIAPLTIESFRTLKKAQIGTYQLFQETYHFNTYKKMHLKGPKSDYINHLYGIDRAMEAGIDDVGLGILFGLYDYRFEVNALLQHIKHLEQQFGVGPHTISVPRLEPAWNSSVSEDPPHKLSDRDFKKIIAILRLTVPYTGLILSTRESAEMRREALSLGISQISAGSKTNPGGYSDHQSAHQFALGDHRSLEEVIDDMMDMGYVPSFCTGCYRMGRTGEDFMDIAKPGLIKHYCLPNALTSFKEYLVQFAGENTKMKGEKLINQMLEDIPRKKREEETRELLKRILWGEKDLFI